MGKHPFLAVWVFFVFLFCSSLSIRMCYYIAVKTFNDPAQTEKELIDWYNELDRKAHQKRIKDWKNVNSI